MKLLIILTCILLFSFVGFLISNESYYPSKGEQLVNQILAKTAHIIERKYHLKLSGEGVAMPGGPIRELTLSFDTNARHTKENLRELLVKCAQELLDQVNTNEEIQPFLIKAPFTIENVEVIIFNRDQNNREVYDPEISVARISNGILTYKTTDPEDNYKFKNRIKETYEEALKALQNSSDQ